MSSPKDIYWMASPLGIPKRIELNEKASKSKFFRPAVKIINPANEYHFFRKIQHWTLKVNGTCYELSPDTKKKFQVFKLTNLVGGDTCKPQYTDADAWHAVRRNHGIEPEERRIGQTWKTHEEIMAESKYYVLSFLCEFGAGVLRTSMLISYAVDRVWEKFHHGWYGLFTQNCQNFATLLFESIAMKISDAEKSLWGRIPDPLSYRLQELSTASLGGRAAVGTKAAYLTGAEAVASTAGPGAITSVATEGVGTASVAGTQAAGATQATAAGAMHGSASTAAGTKGVVAAGAKGATVGGTGATKVGIGAKVAGLGKGIVGIHGAAAGKAAAVGMAKVGTAAAFAHPVTGVVATTGLIYVAVRGKRSKRWKKGKKGHESDDVEELSVTDMLEAEEKILEQAENPDQALDDSLVTGLDDFDKKADDELAEHLKLTLVTTEPAEMSEEEKLNAGCVPAGEDTKRSQTTV